MRAVFLASLTWCVVGVGIMLSRGFFHDFDPSLGLAGLMSFVVLAGLARWLVGRTHQGRLVFWCRRFGHMEQAAGHLNRWHGRIIDEASGGLALPVTLQDESVDTPPLVATAAFFPTFAVMMVGSIGSTLWLFEFSWFDTPIGNLATVVVTVLAVTAPSIVAMMCTRWLGVRRVVPGQVVDAIVRAKRGRRSRRGILVLKCSTDDWKQCVTEVLDSVELVIIDATLRSENVEWEIDAATSRLDPRRVLLLVGDGARGADIERTPGERCTVIRYPLVDASDELSSFSESWGRDRHRLANPDAHLDSRGMALAAAIADWLSQALQEADSRSGQTCRRAQQNGGTQDRHVSAERLREEKRGSQDRGKSRGA